MDLERRTPTPRAERILRDIESLTVKDVVWLNRELAKLLGEEPPDIGVREPRRPLRPRSGASSAIVIHPDDSAASVW